MPTIAEGVGSNQSRDGFSSPALRVRERSSPPSPAAAQSPSGLPVRGTFSPDVILATDFYSAGQQFRMSERSSSMLTARAVVGARTPQSLSNKILVSPTIGNGGAKLNRYNTVTTVITPASVAAVTAATQTFSVPAVQTADKLIGYQWKSAQTAKVVTLAVRVTGTGQIAIDFYNSTAGPLTPTGGLITLFLVQ